MIYLSNGVQYDDIAAEGAYQRATSAGLVKHYAPGLHSQRGAAPVRSETRFDPPPKPPGLIFGRMGGK